jgi:hypothetical protein
MIVLPPPAGPLTAAPCAARLPWMALAAGAITRAVCP